MLAPHRGSGSHGKHASPNRQIAAVRRASGESRPIGSGGYRRAAACLLCPQGRASLPRFFDLRICTTAHARLWLLQPRLLPRSHHRPLGPSAAASSRFLRADCRDVRWPVKPRLSEYGSLPFPIHSRPSASLHSLSRTTSNPSTNRVSTGDSYACPERSRRVRS
jgi:hypothetical protein